jgi:hypothetical protein
MAKQTARLIVIAVALLLLGGIAYASIPGPDGVIHGCYKNSTGMLITIDSAASCPTGYTALNWNQTGPQGPAGLAGVHVVSQDNAPQFGQFDCPNSETALWFGAGSTFGAQPVTDLNGRPTGFTFSLPSSSQFTIYMTCAISN